MKNRNTPGKAFACLFTGLSAIVLFLGCASTAITVQMSVPDQSAAATAILRQSRVSPNGYINFIRLLNSGAAAVRSTIPQAKIMIHIAEGGNTADATRFFDNIAAKVDFDYIGLSFYPYWHGTVSQLQTTMDTLAARFGKPVIVAETAGKIRHSGISRKNQLTPCGPSGSSRNQRQSLKRGSPRFPK